MLTQMQNVYVDREKILSEEELLDLTSIGRSLPGAMICNVGMLFGYRLNGVLGGTLCVLGMTVSPFVVLCLVVTLYEQFMSNQLFAAAMYGIRAAVPAIIISAIIKMCKNAYRFPPCVIISVLSFVFYYFLETSCITLVIAGALAGIILCEINERTAGKP